MNEKKNDDSLLDNLKAAGASIGSVVSDFADRLKDDHSEKTAGEDQATLIERLKEAASEARERLSAAQGGEDIKSATSDFASKTDSIVRELFGSVRSAADGTRDTEAYNDISQRVSEAVGSVRGSVDEAVTKVRGQKEDAAAQTTSTDKADKAEEADDADADAASKLDNLMNRLRGNAHLADQDNVDPDIIDGEVIDEKNSDEKNSDGK